MPSGAQETADAEAAEEQSPWRTREERRIVLWRYAQARAVGLEPVNARLFAESSADLGTLRSLRGRGCPPQLALSIVL
jgi:hypothetical protein